MGERLTPALDWFVDNLELQIEDLVLEERKVKPVLYLDTADVRAAVLGLDAYVEGDYVDVHLFGFPDRPLVAALADSGWLGQFHMLQPHQDEFLGLIKSAFYLPDDAELRFRQRAEAFLNALQLPKMNDSGLSCERQMTDAQAENLVKMQAGHAQEFFKAMHCIRGNWRTRLTRWFKENVFYLEKDRISYSNIVASPEFAQARGAFEESRPNLAASNYADAAAMCILIDKVNGFRREGEDIPRFFVSTGLFESVSERAGITAKLTYRVPDGRSGSIFRNWEYFVFRATFRPPAGIGKPGGEAELLELRKKIKHAQDKNKAHAEILDELRYDGKPLRVLINELRSFYFLENVWLPAAARSYVEKVHSDFVEAAYLLGKDVVFQKAVSHAVQTAKEALAENVEEYRAVKSLLFALESAPIQIPTYRAQLAVETDPYRAYGLLRFGFPRDAKDEIVGLLEGLFSRDEQLRQDARIKIVRAFYYEETSNTSYLAKLCAACAVLWILDDHKTLVQRLPVALRDRHTSLKGLFAASVFDGRIEREVGNARAAIGELQKLYNSSNSPGLAVLLGYLYFHDWLYSGYTPVYTASETGGARKEKAEELVKMAMEHAQKASETHSDEATRVYALNQYVYYWAEGVAGQPSKFVLDAVDVLARYKSNTAIWQYRFDDTLARYYYRMALMEKDDRMTFLHDAKKHSDWAVRDGPGDARVEQFNAMLTSIEARWMIEENSGRPESRKHGL